MPKKSNVVDLDTSKQDPDEMSINNLVLAPIRRKLDAAMIMAVHVANGLNTVTVTMKMVIQDVAVVDGEKIIHAPKWSVKVNAKTGVFDEAEELATIIVTEEGGQMLAIDADSRQIAIDDLAAGGK